MDDHTKFLKRALELAQDSIERGGGPFGAVVVKDGNVIAEGSNSVTLNQDPTAHAEVVAIRNACKSLNSFQLDGCILYSSCEPCPMCLGAIYWARPDKIFFASTRYDAAEIGFDDQLIYDEIERNSDEREIPFVKMELDEAKEVFENWKKKEDKVEY